MQQSLANILEEAEGHTESQKQAEILMKNDSFALKEILTLALDPNVKWLLPSSNPPYKPVAEGTDQEGRLYYESRRLKYFVNTVEGIELSQMTRETLFIEFLETIAPKDAELVLRVKNKALKISVAAVKIAFPDVAKDW